MVFLHVHKALFSQLDSPKNLTFQEHKHDLKLASYETYRSQGSIPSRWVQIPLGPPCRNLLNRGG